MNVGEGPPSCGETALVKHMLSNQADTEHYLPVSLLLLRGRGEGDVEGALHRALDSYYHGPAWWRHELVPRCMRQDWSWSRSAQAYLDLYRSIAVPA